VHESLGVEAARGHGANGIGTPLEKIPKFLGSIGSTREAAADPNNGDAAHGPDTPSVAEAIVASIVAVLAIAVIVLNRVVSPSTGSSAGQNSRPGA